MGEARETRRVEYCQLQFEVSGMPDVVQPHQPTHAKVLPEFVTVEYRRTDNRRWACCLLQVVGRKRLRGGEVGDYRVKLIYRNRAGIVEVPLEQWPTWLRDLVNQNRPGGLVRKTSRLVE
jgi:hypothetical protein